MAEQLERINNGYLFKVKKLETVSKGTWSAMSRGKMAYFIQVFTDADNSDYYRVITYTVIEGKLVPILEKPCLIQGRSVSTYTTVTRDNVEFTRRATFKSLIRLGYVELFRKTRVAKKKGV